MDGEIWQPGEQTSIDPIVTYIDLQLEERIEKKPLLEHPLPERVAHRRQVEKVEIRRFARARKTLPSRAADAA